MRNTSVLTAAALVLGLSFSGASFAQGMTIAGVEVSENDRVAVQNRCDDLKLAADTTEIGAEIDSEAGDDAVVSGAPEVNEGDNALTTIDLDIISYQDCVDGGWVE